VHTFEAGGLTVWRSGDNLATFDHGPLGLGSLAAHGHADALAVTLRRGADDLIVDPGTLAYHESETARVFTRSTPSHSTVNFGGRSQSEMIGPFQWGRRARVTRAGEAWRCDWWSGEQHTRRVEFAPGLITLEDHAVGPAGQLSFALGPGATVQRNGTRAHVEIGGSVAVFESEGPEPWRVEVGEVAPAFGRRLPALRLSAEMRQPAAITRVRFGPR
jgi:hypothetical protein